MNAIAKPSGIGILGQQLYRMDQFKDT